MYPANFQGNAVNSKDAAPDIYQDKCKANFQ